MGTGGKCRGDGPRCGGVQDGLVVGAGRAVEGAGIKVDDSATSEFVGGLCEIIGCGGRPQQGRDRQACGRFLRLFSAIRGCKERGHIFGVNLLFSGRLPPRRSQAWYPPRRLHGIP